MKPFNLPTLLLALGLTLITMGCQALGGLGTTLPTPTMQVLPIVTASPTDTIPTATATLVVTGTNSVQSVVRRPVRSMTPGAIGIALPTQTRVQITRVFATPRPTWTPRPTPEPTMTPEATSASPLNTFQLIDQGVARGEIDLDHAAVYKVYALFGLGSPFVPGRYINRVPYQGMERCYFWRR